MAAKSGDEHLITALASGASYAKAAAATGLSLRTVNRRMADPDFRRRVSDARFALMEQALGSLASYMPDAAQTLKGLLSSTWDFARLGAARAILETGLKMRDVLELEARIARLEEAMGQQG